MTAVFRDADLEHHLYVRLGSGRVGGFVSAEANSLRIRIREAPNHKQLESKTGTAAHRRNER